MDYVICKIEYWYSIKVWYSMKVNPRWNESDSCTAQQGGPHVALQEVSWARAMDIAERWEKWTSGVSYRPNPQIRMTTLISYP